jgi:hypothetical protein
VTLNQRTSSQANVCSEQEFENLLRRSEEHLKSLRPSVSKSDSLQPNSLKLVPPIRRRDSAA